MRGPASDEVAFVVVSCDKYSDLWDPFFHCLRKFWPDCPYRVYLVTNHKHYGADDVTTVRVGDDRSYSDNLRVAVDQVAEPWMILWLEDVLFSKPVDTRRVQRIIAKAQAIPVGYLKLSPDLPLSYDDDHGEEIGPIPRGVRYRSAVGLSFYQASTLDQLLTPGASAWDLDTSTISDELPQPFYALTRRTAKHPPFVWQHAVIKGRWCWPVIDFLAREGFSDLIGHRKKLGLRSLLYLKLFKLHNAIYRTLKLHWR